MRGNLEKLPQITDVPPAAAAVGLHGLQDEGVLDHEDLVPLDGPGGDRAEAPSGEGFDFVGRNTACLVCQRLPRERKGGPASVFKPGKVWVLERGCEVGGYFGGRDDAEGAGGAAQAGDAEGAELGGFSSTPWFCLRGGALGRVGPWGVGFVVSGE